ncbi:stalk domain-containing protein [Thermotalea metallivorans]|uniref:BIG2 domain-containing protein n=1 Tax=Thermotalea metallivorans TaxID=520762 RepID=A0A140LBT6_9FIRM|nr:stalk domain-containing protein [Thermotalea metallivorans]KXG78011.1 hypothetical protein AN619_03210 [Thermotalea metallivorans]
MNKKTISVLLIGLLFTMLLSTPALALAQYSLELNLSKSTFRKGEDVAGSGIVALNGKGVSGAQVTLKICDAADSSIYEIGQCTADGQGRFQFAFKLPADIAIGTYKLVGKAFDAEKESAFELKNKESQSLLASIRIITNGKTVEKGKTLQLQLEGTMSDGSKVPASQLNDAIWSSSNPSIATVGPKNGLVKAEAKGVATITAKVGNLTDAIDITVIEVTSSNGGGGTTLVLEPSINTRGNTATLFLENAKYGKAQVAPSIIQTLAKDNKPLVVENKGIKIEFAPQSLMTSELTKALEDKNAKLELGAKALTNEEKQEVIQKAALGGNTGLLEIGGMVVELTAQVITKNTNGAVVATKIANFTEPVAVTLDLSGLKLTEQDIAQLTAVRYVKDEQGNIIPVKLGGTYDSKTKTFIFYTDQFSLYSVVKASKLMKIDLEIGKTTTKVNGQSKNNDVAPTIVNNRTMVPVRFIAENLGAEVNWFGDTRTVEMKLDSKTLRMAIDMPIKGFDTSPTIVNGRTLVPLRYVSEELGANVLWFPSTKTVQIVK